MWENALYVGGHDDGLIETGQQAVGAAVCWEFMRSGTARRLRGRVDLVLGGSNWWTIPAWRPRAMFARMEAANAASARHAPSVFGRHVGAPVVHAAIAGPCRCPMPDMPGVMYDGKFQGGALIADATGAILAFREGSEGPGSSLPTSRRAASLRSIRSPTAIGCIRAGGCPRMRALPTCGRAALVRPPRSRPAALGAGLAAPAGRCPFELYDLLTAHRTSPK
jgi:hypothetical protein